MIKERFQNIPEMRSCKNRRQLESQENKETEDIKGNEWQFLALKY